MSVKSAYRSYQRRADRFKTEAKRFGPGAALHRLGIALLNRAVSYRAYRIMNLTLEHAARVRPLSLEGLECREVRCSDLLPFASDPLNGLSTGFLRQADERGDRCFAVFTAQGSLGCYCFYATQPTDIDHEFRFHFPGDMVYLYKAFTHPDWRGKGLNPLGVSSGICWFTRDLKPGAGFVALVQTNNYPSIVSFEKMGFVITNTFRILGSGARSHLTGADRLAKSGYTVERLARAS